MDGQSGVIVLDKAMRPEPVHEMTHPRPGRADHLCQGILIHSGITGSALLSLPKWESSKRIRANAFRSS